MSDKLQNIFNKQKAQQAPDTTNIEEIVQLVGFIVGDEEYSVPILSIQEIIKPISWTRVPQTPKYVFGYSAHRPAGEILAADGQAY